MIFLAIIVLSIVALLVGRLDLAVVGCLVACLYLVLAQAGNLVLR